VNRLKWKLRLKWQKLVFRLARSVWPWSELERVSGLALHARREASDLRRALAVANTTIAELEKRLATGNTYSAHEAQRMASEYLGRKRAGLT
jgi:hypothetical protein